MMPGPDRDRMRSPGGRQSGQAILLVLLLTVVGILAGLMLVSNGILTSEKMQLQNAADASAYGVALAEARDLNFAAYINRAMIANEVAIGQLVGLMSWAAMVRSVPGFLDIYYGPMIKALLASPLAPIGAVLQGIITALQITGNIVYQGTRAFTRLFTRAYAALNRGLSLAQRAMHTATFMFTIGALDDSIRNNAKKAQLSWFGAFALARHYTTYFENLAIRKRGDNYVSSYRQSHSWDSFVERRLSKRLSPSDASQKAGMARFAAMVNASRDPFSDNRAGGWAIPLMPPINININAGNIPLTNRCILCINFNFSVHMERKGGTDVRGVKAGRETHYNWSAVDLVQATSRFRLRIVVLGVTLFNKRYAGGPPHGIGAARAAADAGDDISTFQPRDVLPKYLGGTMPEQEYGHTAIPAYAAVWAWPLPWPGNGNPYLAMQTNNVYPAHRGLPRYMDTRAQPFAARIDGKLHFGIEAPYVLIGLVKEEEHLVDTSTRGRFRLDPDYAADQLAVLGKAQVYFSRPNDLPWFRRRDGKLELANTFNPYWDARLVDTSYLDRTMALAMQQRQPWLPRDVNAAFNGLNRLVSLLPTP